MSKTTNVKEDVAAGLFSAFELILVVLVILGLVFLFQGDPDVWDMLRLRAMEYLKP